ncbi:MAG: amino acid permease [Candidatus Odinarchaeia archaeon]
MAEEKEVFVRKASGLTRVISAWDALIYAFCNPGILYAMLYITWGPATVGPGADMPFAVITVFMLLPIQALYWLFSISMPRSGGEYIYVSRIISPAWGLFASWTLTIVGISWTGQCTVWMINYGAANLFRNQGILSNDPGLVKIGEVLSDLYLFSVNESTMVIWLVCTISLITTFAIMWRGAKASMKLSWISVSGATMGLIVWMIIALTSGPANFAARMDQILSTTTAFSYPYSSYADVLAAAQAIPADVGWGPWPGPGYISVWGTVMAGTTYVNLNTLGATYTTSIAGEIKGVNFAQGLALIGAILLFMAYWEAFYGTAFLGCGTDFWVAMGYADAAGLDYEAFGVMANGMSMALFLTDNAVLMHLVTIGFMMATYGSVLGMSFGPVRNMFAWSFDGVLPYWVNKVDRRGSPYVAVILGAVIAWAFMTIYVFTTLLFYILYTITVWFTGWIIVGIAGIIFPWRRRDIFEKSPELAKKKIGGVPVISILGVLTAGISAFTVFATTAPPMTGGPIDAVGLLGTVLFLVIVPFVLYYGAYFYRKSQGVPMDLRFKEIPPD